MNSEQQTCTASSEQENDCLEIRENLVSQIKLSGIPELIDLRNKYPYNPIIGYLNINSLRNKIIDLREVIKKAPLDIFCIDETKLDESYPDWQFKIENYQFPPFRRDKKPKSGGKMVFVKKGLIVKRIKSLETKNSETICIELTVSKKKWCILFAYRHPKQEHLSFFNEITQSLSQIVNKYENIFIAGDLNIDMLDPKCDKGNHFSALRDTFDLTNLVKDPTCFKTKKGTLIDVLLTNKPKCFQKTISCDIGLSDVHTFVATILRATFKKLPPKTVRYRSYKNFHENNFLHELDQKLIQGEFHGSEDPYSKLTEIFSNILDKHAPLKSKKVRGNQAPFMNKLLSKAIMSKSRIRNKYLEWPSRENFLAYKKIKNKCNNLVKKSKKQYFEKISHENSAQSKPFWNAVKPFMTNKGVISNESIVIKAKDTENVKVKNSQKEVQVKANELIKDENVLVEMFNKHYINIVEKTSGEAPKCIGNPANPALDKETVKEIINKYKDHPSVLKIKDLKFNETSFEFPKATPEEINKIIKNLNPNKATGPDRLPLKIICASADIIDCPISHIINKDLNIDKYSEDAKTALVNPLYKKDDRDEIKNYRPVSLLNGFSKIYERFLHNSLSKFTEKIFSEFISAYRKNYSSNHVLLKLIDDWKASLDNNKIVGTVLMDLSKAFDCIPHDLLIAKLHAYGLSIKSLTFIYSYLKRRKQGVKINDTESIFKILLSGVPQGSILGPILFNIFINDLFLFIKDAKLANFADDNTIHAENRELEPLLDILEKESKNAINWFKTNEMIVNPDKFQVMIVNRRKKLETVKLKINEVEIPTRSSVTLLGVEIDNELNFNNHISTICKKAGNKLNAIGRIQNFLRQKEKELLINTFVYSNFNYCPLVWHFSSKKSTLKIEKIQERCLRLLQNNTTDTYEDLLAKSNQPSMEVKRIRTLAIEIFKTLNDMNPNYMKSIFHLSPYVTHKKYDLYVHKRNTTKYGNHSLKVFGAQVWNSLPEKIKALTTINTFKDYIKNWFGPKCKCSLCRK